ncbi:MAG: U32 family peptidase [Lachnospiraceae bacterium]|nr:U32 family peptidase [Lachnospiraceae bacterium]
MTRKPELLAPAGSLPVLKTAVRYGADAVYIGGDAFGLRAGAQNFSPDEMREGIAFAHAHGVKVYVTANILAHNRDLAAAEAYFQELKAIGPDALIISDPGMFTIARRVCPEIDIHISTQANNTNYETYRFWQELGAKRAVSARELSLDELKEVRAQIPCQMEIETFVHGAMCISYSGRCLLSAFLTGRDANQGSCTHPCRWNYTLMEEKRPGEYFPVEENERGTYIFNSKDLCMIGHIPELCEAGIDSFKIEGRMKTALYVATVTRAYRRAIDDYFTDPALYESNRDWYEAEVRKCTHRQYTTGFFFGKPSAETQIYDSSTYINDYVYLGSVEETGNHPCSDSNAETRLYPGNTEETKNTLARITQKNKFAAGDSIEIMKPDGRNIRVTVRAMYNGNMEAVESCPHAGETIWLDLAGEAQAGDVLRMQKIAILKNDQEKTNDN